MGIFINFSICSRNNINLIFSRLVDPGDIPRSMDPASRVFGLDAIEVLLMTKSICLVMIIRGRFC